MKNKEESGSSSSKVKIQRESYKSRTTFYNVTYLVLALGIRLNNTKRKLTLMPICRVNLAKVLKHRDPMVSSS